jgi:hypothetical protein
MTPANLPLCPPRTDLCPACGEEHTYICGRSVLYRDPAKAEEACPDGLFVCVDCVEVFGGFMSKAYDARAVRKEHEEDPVA